MVATQFSLLNWNHLSLKQREILISRNLAVAQNALLNTLAHLPNSLSPVSSRVVRDHRGATPNKYDTNTFDAMSLTNTFPLSCVFTSCTTDIIKSVATCNKF